MTRRKRWIYILVGLYVLGPLLVPLPWPMRASDREYAVKVGLASIFEGRRVWQFTSRDWPRWARLRHAEQMSGPGVRCRYQNFAAVSDNSILRHRLEPLPVGLPARIDNGEVVLSVSEMAWPPERRGSLSITYQFGSQGGLGWEVWVWRSMCFRHAFFIHWLSI